ncbi:hypothetical protein MKW92_037715 [Papaver armeniacum]|nr:hypothetical protein MKW92_037715 [Papaver armeniacum]
MEKIGQLTFTAPIPPSSSQSRTQFVSPLLLIHSSNKHSLNSLQSSNLLILIHCYSSSSPPPSLTTNSSNSNILEISEIRENSKKWKWRGKRRNMRVLGESNTVYAIDLLGFGDSDKPSDFAYTMELWAQLILDFLDEVVQKPTVLVGNSIGSLACVIATSDIKGPADAAGALDAFVSIITGPPGRNPIKLMRRISQPVLVLWGNEDPFTPLEGPVGRFFSSLPSTSPNITLSVLDGVGHCPHDDRPELVHGKLLPWLASLPSS